MEERLLQFYIPRNSPDEVHQISIRVTAEQDEFLIELAKKIGVKKADVFRLALEEWLRSGPHAKAAQEIVKKRGAK